MQLKSGIININKEAGYTSFDVIARLRGILGIRKIGHTGTLDPDATGVLPVCVGSATKVCGLLTEKDKEYVAWMRLGVKTDTQDMSGTVMDTREVKVTENQLREAVMEFTGEIAQIPPMYSALKVGGKKLCDLARKGVEVERSSRMVRIYSIQIEEIKIPLVKMRISCSRGTYIRTLCHDIGIRLGCFAAMESLVRTKVSIFILEEAYTLSQVEQKVQEGRLSEIMMPVDRLFSQYPAFRVKGMGDRLLANGNSLDISLIACMDERAPEEECLARMYREDGRFAGIYQRKEKKFIPYKMFLE